MWTFGVVVPPPLFDDDLCFSQRIEDFPVEEFRGGSAKLNKSISGVSA